MYSLNGRTVCTITKANSQNYFLTTTYRNKFYYEHPWWQDLVYPDDIRHPCPRVSKHAGGYRGQNFPYGDFQLSKTLVYDQVEKKKSES